MRGLWNLLIARHSSAVAPARKEVYHVLLLIVAMLMETAHAGGGPENVLVVVNGDSPVSLTVANTYIELRNIPPEHVLWLHDIPYPETISIDAFAISSPTTGSRKKSIASPIRRTFPMRLISLVT